MVIEPSVAAPAADVVTRLRPPSRESGVVDDEVTTTPMNDPPDVFDGKTTIWMSTGGVTPIALALEPPLLRAESACSGFR